jgi:hypothetical protein
MPPVQNGEPNESETLAALTDAQKALDARYRFLIQQLNAVDQLRKQLEAALAVLGETRSASRGRRPGPASIIKPAIIEILKNAGGQPVHAQEILDAVKARGISVSEKDPKATIVTALLRMHRERMARGPHVEGVAKLGKNFFAWVEGEPTGDPPSEPQQPSALFSAALLGLASQRAPSRP